MGNTSQIIANRLINMSSNLFNRLLLMHTSVQLMSISSSTLRNHLNITLLSITLPCHLFLFKTTNAVYYMNIPDSATTRGQYTTMPHGNSASKHAIIKIKMQLSSFTSVAVLNHSKLTMNNYSRPVHY